MEARLSVCIPVYNGERYIRGAIEQVLRQTYQGFELVIIDNASTDQTAEIVRSFHDPRVRFIQNAENVGLVGNWNLCLEHAAAEYVQILCVDDMITDDCLEEKVGVLDGDSGVVLAFSASSVCDAGGGRLMARRPFHGDRKLDGKAVARKSFRGRNLYGEPSNVMFRKGAARAEGGFDPAMGYLLDWEYWMRLCLHGDAGYIDRELSTFRISPQSTTSGMLRERKEATRCDKRFVGKCMADGRFGLSGLDAITHAVVNRASIYLKAAFVAFVNRKYKCKGR